MAATQTVHQLAYSHNPATQTPNVITPRHGVVTLFGYGISVSVDRGHLVFRPPQQNLWAESGSGSRPSV